MRHSLSHYPNRPTEKTGWGMRPRLAVDTLDEMHQKDGCNDFGLGGTCSICTPGCTCTVAERTGKPFGWHKPGCPKATR